MWQLLLWNFNGDNICSSNSMIRDDAKVHALKPHACIHASVLQQGPSAVLFTHRKLILCVPETKYRLLWCTRSTAGPRIKRSDFDPTSTAAISSPLNCFVLEDLWANGGECFFRAALRLNGNVDETVYRREYLSDEFNKKNVNESYGTIKSFIWKPFDWTARHSVLVYTFYKCFLQTFYKL